MRRRPLLLFLSACLFLYFPLELAVRVAYWGQTMDAVDIGVSLVLPFILIVGLIQVTKVGWYTLIALISLWGVRDLHSYYVTYGATTGQLMVHLMIYVISLAYFINPRIRHLYFDPKLRWWRIKPRFETHLPMVMQQKGRWHYPILRNISEGGCFVETTELAHAGSVFTLSIPLPNPLNVSVIRAEGEVRWVSTASARPGMGIQFLRTDAEQAKALRRLVQTV